MRLSALLSIAVLSGIFVGCTEAPAPKPAAPKAEPTPPPAAPPPPTPEQVAQASAQTSKVLSPSPLDLEAEVKAAGVADSLAALVPALPPEPPATDKDRVALRTGVVLAYTVLGGPAVPKPAFLAQLRSIRAGMQTLGAGAGLLTTLDNNIVQVENDAAARADFLRALDDVASMADLETGFGPNDTTGPLLQAGAWVAGTQLVAQAVVKSGKADAADKLLRRPEVPAWFLGYLKGEGAEKASGVSEQLRTTLTQLDTIARKPSLTLEDAQAVADATGSLLKLL